MKIYDPQKGRMWARRSTFLRNYKMMLWCAGFTNDYRRKSLLRLMYRIKRDTYWSVFKNSYCDCWNISELRSRI